MLIKPKADKKVVGPNETHTVSQDKSEALRMASQRTLPKHTKSLSAKELSLSLSLNRPSFRIHELFLSISVCSPPLALVDIRQSERTHEGSKFS